jgi:hypothetical protein
MHDFSPSAAHILKTALFESRSRTVHLHDTSSNAPKARRRATGLIGFNRLPTSDQAPTYNQNPNDTGTASPPDARFDLNRREGAPHRVLADDFLDAQKLSQQRRRRSALIWAWRACPDNIDSIAVPSNRRCHDGPFTPKFNPSAAELNECFRHPDCVEERVQHDRRYRRSGAPSHPSEA